MNLAGIEYKSRAIRVLYQRICLWNVEKYKARGNWNNQPISFLVKVSLEIEPNINRMLVHINSVKLFIYCSQSLFALVSQFLRNSVNILKKNWKSTLYWFHCAWELLIFSLLIVFIYVRLILYALTVYTLLNLDEWQLYKI